MSDLATEAKYQKVAYKAYQAYNNAVGTPVYDFETFFAHQVEFQGWISVVKAIAFDVATDSDLCKAA